MKPKIIGLCYEPTEDGHMKRVELKCDTALKANDLNIDVLYKTGNMELLRATPLVSMNPLSQSDNVENFCNDLHSTNQYIKTNTPKD